MADEHLRDYVLERADKDTALSEQARLVVLAAFSGDEDLAEVLSDDVTSQAVVDALTTPDRPDEVPVGAYLTSIGVQGFRGIGAGVTVPLQPGPGLVVIAGRNGSGKSTLAEGLELALTGINSRWVGKSTVWSTAWRNLHAGDPASIRVGIAEQGRGETAIGVDWPIGGDVAVSDMKRESPNVLGWAAALEMYRPMLSYDELGTILEGTPSELYDQLYKLLGLEQLTTAMIRLDLEVKRLKEPSVAARKARDALRPRLDAHEDPRAVTALAALGKVKPDVDAVRPLITQSSAATAPASWRHAAGLMVPEHEQIEQACTAMRSAADGLMAASLAADVLAADRVKLLETGLLFHEKHGTQPCPVCFDGTLDDDWAQRALAAMAKEQEATRALTAARSANHRARTNLIALVQGVQPPPAEDASLTTVAAARLAYEAFSMPVDDDVAMANQVEATLPDLRATYEALRREASELIVTRDDAWHPFAIELADWLKKAEHSATVASKLKDATTAQKWLQENAEVLRNERIAPLADRAKEIWAALRQESNVELAEIRLVGQKTSRKVALRAGVDGAETEAFGVMSQGELQALALAIFIPRATSDESPFRFVVLDDPIQAMDPSKIEGFLSVLTELAAERQVIVFTHDDRLPAAIRRADAPARVIQVNRRANSVVSVEESSNPASRALDDAVAIAYDENVPDEVKRRAIPHLCRDALEYAAWDVYSMRTLTAGASRTEAEAAWEAAKRIRARLTLALGGGDTALDAWLGTWSARKLALKVANKGVHDGFDDYKAAVNATRTAVNDLGNTTG